MAQDEIASYYSKALNDVYSALPADPVAAFQSLKSSKLIETFRSDYDAVLNYILTRDAVLLYHAMLGIGSDEDMLIRILCNRTKSQLQKIDRLYQNLSTGNSSRRTLIECIKSELSGDFERFMKFMIESRGKFLAHQLKSAMVRTKLC